MVLVVGGTGMLGSRVVNRLLDRAADVRVLTRRPDSTQAGALRKRGAEIVKGDLCDASSLAPALRGVQQLVLSAHALAGPGVSRTNNPHTCDRDGIHALLDEAVVAGVGQVVYVSIIGAAPDAPIEFVRIKYETEQHVRASGMAWTIIRPAAFMEMWADLIGGPVIHGEKTMVFGDGENPVNFVSADDVAEYVLISLYDPRAKGQVLTVGGPENLTHLQVVDVFARASGREPKVQKTPVTMMKTLSAVLGPFNPGLSRQMAGGAWMATSNQCVDMSELLSRFPVQLTRLEDMAARLVEQSAVEPEGAVVS